MCMMGTANWTRKYVCVTPKYTCLCFRKYPKMHMCSLVKISFNLATLKYFHYLRHACVCFKSENEVCQRDCSWKGLHSCWVCTSCVSPETGRLCFRRNGTLCVTERTAVCAADPRSWHCIFPWQRTADRTVENSVSLSDVYCPGNTYYTGNLIYQLKICK